MVFRFDFDVAAVDVAAVDVAALDDGSVAWRHESWNFWKRLWKEKGKCTMVQNRKNTSINSLSHEQGSEQSERASKQVSAAERASKASSAEQANE